MPLLITAARSHFQSHAVHPDPSCCSQRARTVLWVRARGIQMSARMSRFCSENLMVYLHLAAAHESCTRLQTHAPDPPANEKLSLVLLRYKSHENRARMLLLSVWVRYIFIIFSMMGIVLIYNKWVVLFFSFFIPDNKFIKNSSRQQ